MTPRERVVIGAVFVLGLLHWALFLGWGSGTRLSFQAGDWPKEYRYYAVLQQAVTEARIPWTMTKPVQETRKFLAIPEATWSPQVLLLRVVDVPLFLTANVMLGFAAGFVGCLALRRRYQLTLVPFTLLVLLFSFNGHVTSHLAVGHTMWVGYFLLSSFVLFTLALLDGSRRAPVAIGLVLFLMLLQGHFHQFTGCVMLLGLLGVARRRLIRPVAEAIAWSAALAVYRLVPAAAVLAGRRDQGFFTGYGSVSDMLASLVLIRDVGWPRSGGAWVPLSWWEFDAYVGVVGLLFVVWLGIAARRWRRVSFAGLEYRALDLPLLLLTVLSYRDLYAVVTTSGIPLLSAERVSSRFLVLPLVFLIVLACIRLQRLWDAAAPGRRRTLAGAALVLAIGVPLSVHSARWSIPAIEGGLPQPPHERDLAIRLVPPGEADGRYVRVVQASAAFTALALLAAAWRWRRTSPPQ